MDRGLDAHPSSFAPVPAYPRRAVEQYLSDARRAWDESQAALRAAEARRSAALAALESAGDSHRLLGSMVVEAQRDLAARRDHAEAAAAGLLASADAEAERILSAARSQVAALLGGRPAAGSAPVDHVLAPAGPAGGPLADGPEAEPGDGEDSDDDWPDAPGWTIPAARTSAPGPRSAFGDDAPVHAVAASDLGAAPVELWPARRPGTVVLDGIRWRPRWRRPHQVEWPFNAAEGDESYFTRLRDELRADGTINAWFESA